MIKATIAMAVVSCSILVSTCEPASKGTVGPQAVDTQYIVRQFGFDALPVAEAREPDLTAPRDASRRLLKHADPLELPDGLFTIAGSDTVSPVTTLILQEFNSDGYIGKFRQTQSSTGSGMRAMCSGESIDLVNASRAMKDSEKAACEENGIVPVQFKVGYDPFVLITNTRNDWLRNITQEQLVPLFKSTQWSQIDPSYPKQPMAFYVPRKAGGAMSAMTKFVYGDSDAPFIRDVENGHFYPYNLELTRDLALDKYGIGFASYGKLLRLKRLRVNIIPVDGFAPVLSGQNYPIKRSLYILTNTQALKKPAVKTFIAYYLNRAPEVMPPLGFSPLQGWEASAERGRIAAILDSSIGRKRIARARRSR